MTSFSQLRDLAARYGGEEFAIIAPHTNPYNLRSLAERLRRAIEAEEVEFEGQTLKVTASMGAACIGEFRSPEDAQALIKLADSLLYRAKKNGRNRSEVFKRLQLPGR